MGGLPFSVRSQSLVVTLIQAVILNNAIVDSHVYNNLKLATKILFDDFRLEVCDVSGPLILGQSECRDTDDNVGENGALVSASGT